MVGRFSHLRNRLLAVYVQHRIRQPRLEGDPRADGLDDTEMTNKHISSKFQSLTKPGQTSQGAT